MGNTNSDYQDLALLAIQEGRNHLIFAYEMEDDFGLKVSASVKIYNEAKVLYSCGYRSDYRLYIPGTVR